MTPNQRGALETLVGRALPDQVVEQITPMVEDGRYPSIAQALAGLRQRRSTSERYSSLGIAKFFKPLNGLPAALASEMVLQKIEGFAEAAIQSSDPSEKLLGAQIKRQMTHLYTDGIELGDPAIAEMLAPVVSAGEMTQDEVDALQDVALEDYPVTEFEVRAALEGAV